MYVPIKCPYLHVRPLMSLFSLWVHPLKQVAYSISLQLGLTSVVNQFTIFFYQRKKVPSCVRIFHIQLDLFFSTRNFHLCKFSTIFLTVISECSQLSTVISSSSSSASIDALKRILCKCHTVFANL